MSDQFVGEIRMFAGNYAPNGWATCDGQLLPIAQNTALFSLLGTMYGGNGTSTFALPNLGGRFPMNAGQGPGLSSRYVGDVGGQQSETLSVAEIPAHSHGLMAALSPTSGSPGPGVALAPDNPAGAIYRAPSSPQAMAPQTLSPAGSSQAHNNMQPFLAVTFIIALQGIFPPRS